jgi:hypothetical protein
MATVIPTATKQPANLSGAPLTQTTSFASQGASFPENHESAFDKLTMIAQQHDAQIQGQAAQVQTLQAQQTGADTVTALLFGSISGNVLTINSITGIVSPGVALSYPGSPAGLAVQSLGTSTGGTGTVILNQNVGTVASQSMTANGTGAVVPLGLLNTLSSPGKGLGDSLVAVLAPGAGAGPRTQHQVNADFVRLTDYYANGVGGPLVDPTGTIDNAGGMAAAYTTSPWISIAPGVYNISSFPNLTTSTTRIVGNGTAVFNFTGTGAALQINTPSGTGPNNLVVENVTINGTASCTTGVSLCWLMHLDMRNVRVKNVTGAGFYMKGVISSTFTNLYCSTNEGGITVPTTDGLVLDVRNGNEWCNSNTFINPCMEGLRDWGIRLRGGSSSNVFICGTCEDGNNGISIEAGSYYNTFLGMDLEANTGVGVQCAGGWNTFEGLMARSTNGTITASCSGKVLTLLSAGGSTFQPGAGLLGPGIPRDTALPQVATSGTWGQANSTYILNTTPGTVASESMTVMPITVHLTTGATSNVFRGGHIDTLVIDAGVKNTILDNVDITALIDNSTTG